MQSAKNRGFSLCEKTEIRLVIKAEGIEPVGHRLTWGEDLPNWLKHEILAQLRICGSCREAKTSLGEVSCPTCQLHQEWEQMQAKTKSPPIKGGKKKK